MKEIQQLRCIALKLGVSGTATPIAQTRLYKDSYGFVKLQVYVPITQNTQSPICTAFCTTTDESGRVKISTGNYNLLYVGEFDLDGKGYSLFESYMPKEFTKVATAPDGLKITFNYYDTEAVVDEHGEVVLDSDGMPKRRATDLLVSSTYITTVYAGGWNNEGVELNLSASEASQIVENMRNISAMQLDVMDIQDEMQTLNNDLASEVERASGAETALSKSIGEVSEDIGNLKDSTEQVLKDIENTIEQAQSELEKTSQFVNDASLIVDDAKTTVETISEYKKQIDNAVAELETQISQGGSNIIVDGALKSQVEFDEDPQEQLNIKVDTLIGDREILIAKFKKLYKKYADSFKGTDDEVSDEMFEEIWAEIAQYSTDDLLKAYIMALQMFLYPKGFQSGEGLIDDVKTEVIADGYYSKLIGTKNKETGDVRVFQTFIDPEEDPNDLYILISNIFAGGGASGNGGRIRLIDTGKLGRSSIKYGWTMGTSSLKMPEVGVYLVEFSIMELGTPIIGCSIGVCHGYGEVGTKKESYTPCIVRIDGEIYAKMTPYRKDSTQQLNLYMEIINPANGNYNGADIVPDIVKIYRII